MLVENHEVVRVGAPAPERVDADPNWLTPVSDFHRAAPGAAVVVADAAVVLATCLLSGATRVGASVATAAFLVVALACRLYDNRGAIEVQGLSWYVSAISLPLLALAGALALTD